MSKKILLSVSLALMVAGLIIVGAVTAATDMDFSRFGTVKLETHEYEIGERLTGITVDVDRADVTVTRSDDDACKVICLDSDKIAHTVEVKDGELTVTSRDVRKWYEHIGIFFGDTYRVTVYLPGDEYDDLRLKTVSGDISVEEGLGFRKTDLKSTSGDIDFSASAEGNFSVKTTSGRIKAQNLSGGNLSAVSTSGEIRLSQIDFAYMTVKTTSGDIDLGNASADTLSVKSTSGDVRLDSVTVQGRAELKTTSGDIAFDRADAGSLSLSSVSGDVKGTLLSPKDFSVKTTSGSINVPGSDPSAGRCEISTTSGNVHITLQS